MIYPVAREGYTFSDTRNSPQSDYSGRSDGAGLENHFSIHCDKHLGWGEKFGRVQGENTE